LAVQPRAFGTRFMGHDERAVDCPRPAPAYTDTASH